MARKNVTLQDSESNELNPETVITQVKDSTNDQLFNESSGVISTTAGHSINGASITDSSITSEKLGGDLDGNALKEFSYFDNTAHGGNKGVDVEAVEINTEGLDVAPLSAVDSYDIKGVGEITLDEISLNNADYITVSNDTTIQGDLTVDGSINIESSGDLYMNGVSMFNVCQIEFSDNPDGLFLNNGQIVFDEDNYYVLKYDSDNGWITFGDQDNNCYNYFSGTTIGTSYNGHVLAMGSTNFHWDDNEVLSFSGSTASNNQLTTIVHSYKTDSSNNRYHTQYRFSEDSIYIKKENDLSFSNLIPHLYLYRIDLADLAIDEDSAFKFNSNNTYCTFISNIKVNRLSELPVGKYNVLQGAFDNTNSNEFTLCSYLFKDSAAYYFLMADDDSNYFTIDTDNIIYQGQLF